MTRGRPLVEDLGGDGDGRVGAIGCAIHLKGGRALSEFMGGDRDTTETEREGGRTAYTATPTYTA